MYFDALIGDEPAPICPSFERNFIAEINAGLEASTTIVTTTGVKAKAHIVSSIPRYFLKMLNVSFVNRCEPPSVSFSLAFLHFV